MMGKIYKLLLDFVRSRDWLTRMVWGFTIHRKKMPVTWDQTSLCLKKALDRELGAGPFSFLDMGSGQVGLLGQYVKRTHPQATVVAADIYDEFVANARFNSELNGLAVDFIQSDLFDNVPGRFDVVAFNPPYVPSAPDETLNYRHVRYSGVDGGDTTRRFLRELPNRLTEGGRVFLGINCFYLPESRCREIFAEEGYKIESVYDRWMNTARAFVLRPKQQAVPGGGSPADSMTSAGTD